MQRLWRLSSSSGSVPVDSVVCARPEVNPAAHRTSRPCAQTPATRKLAVPRSSPSRPVAEVLSCTGHLARTDDVLLQPLRRGVGSVESELTSCVLFMTIIYMLIYTSLMGLVAPENWLLSEASIAADLFLLDQSLSPTRLYSRLLCPCTDIGICMSSAATGRTFPPGGLRRPEVGSRRHIERETCVVVSPRP